MRKKKKADKGTTNRLLRSHIAREDAVLLPVARELLGAHGLAAVARQLDE